MVTRDDDVQGVLLEGEKKTGVTTMNVRPSMIERASLNCQLRFHKVFLSALVARLSQATERLSANASAVNAYPTAR